ncbi:hypothetical protein LRS03_23855 [Rhizobacter sp. J219]|uniref:PEP-utilizing enzyme n=1 Tax=Rhizobacter sp. J219 TaxID=2898430 RepID=UPI0021507235|nr:PEP-utilizing enzyme [Rhizobacter sp. J219]MCR5885727.1 hypothetical protein [Rhizobacter sp. J219]
MFGIAGNGRVLDWQINALGEACGQVVFVGGYRLPEIVALYPDLHAVINPDWAATGVVGSLLKAEGQLGLSCLVSYADVLYRVDLVRKVCGRAADVVIAVDSHWRERYDSRSMADLSMAEVVLLGAEGSLLSAHGRAASARPPAPDAEFVGLARLGERAVALLRLWAARPEIARWDFPQLLNAFVAEGLQVTAVDCQGDWAELNAPQDVAHFVLGTKAQTLQRLRPMVRCSRIGEQVTFTVGEWRADPSIWMSRVRGAFGTARLIVRSSALGEDGFQSSHAGRFDSVLDVDAADARVVAAAIGSVVASYADTSLHHQVLVQRMVDDIAFSGVVMTRTLSHGAPYRVFNYDETSGASDTVTSGAGVGLKTLVMHRNAAGLPPGAPAAMPRLLEAVREIEDLVGHDSLDIEFIVASTGEVHVLQARPIAISHGHWRGSDELVERSLQVAQREFQRLQAPAPFVLGRRTVYSVMTDWNPAEIIGTRPRRLACSLYAALITNSVWARQRREYGYRAVEPQPLMQVFAGHPYIDVRASLNSFIPADVDNALAARLVDHAIDRLVAEPDLHDKVEFEVAFTSLSFDFNQRGERLIAEGFSPAEVAHLRAALLRLTRHAFDRVHRDARAVDEFSARLAMLLQAPGLAPLRQALALVDDCCRFGTLAFAHLARAGFVATALLKSAVATGVIDEDEQAVYLQSIRTVATDCQEDVEQLQLGTMSLEDFLVRHGHLRPGTYEITTPSYAEAPEHYLARDVAKRPLAHRQSHGTPWPMETQKRFEAGLTQLGLNVNFEQADFFMRAAIAGRERAKFVFTRGLSRALDQLVAFGQEMNVSREELSHLSLEDLQAVQSGRIGADIAGSLRMRAEEGALVHALALGIELPPVLVDAQDFLRFFYPEASASFVGNAVTAEVVCLDEVAAAPTGLAGKVVLILRADPGHDWLFGKGIAGLVTAYGGANSHMAVRAAEFGLPAALGVGEKRYHRLAACRRLRLDSRLRTITELH